MDKKITTLKFRSDLYRRKSVMNGQRNIQQIILRIMKIKKQIHNKQRKRRKEYNAKLKKILNSNFSKINRKNGYKNEIEGQIGYFNAQDILLIIIFLIKQMEQQKKLSRIHWTSEEEHLLRELGEKERGKKWVKISKKINALNPNFKRTAKQCREKYVNHVQYNEIPPSSDWSQQEMNTLFNQYRQKGPKWKLISFSLPNKPQNTIKNKFYGALRKFIRKMNSICRVDMNKYSKPIQERSIIKIINFNDSIKMLPPPLCDESRLLKNNLLKKLKKGLQGYDDWEQPRKNEIKNIISDIHSFNSKCRYFCSKNGKVCRFFQINKNQQKNQGSSSNQTQEKLQQNILSAPFVKVQQDE